MDAGYGGLRALTGMRTAVGAAFRGFEDGVGFSLLRMARFP